MYREQYRYLSVLLAKYSRAICETMTLFLVYAGSWTPRIKRPALLAIVSIATGTQFSLATTRCTCIDSRLPRKFPLDENSYRGGFHRDHLQYSCELKLEGIMFSFSWEAVFQNELKFFACQVSPCFVRAISCTVLFWRTPAMTMYVIMCYTASYNFLKLF